MQVRARSRAVERSHHALSAKNNNIRFALDYGVRHAASGKQSGMQVEKVVPCAAVNRDALLLLEAGSTVLASVAAPFLLAS